MPIPSVNFNEVDELFNTDRGMVDTESSGNKQ
jgi:hypothetical protein